MSNSNKPLLLQWNCRGIRAAAPELNERIKGMDAKPLAVLLQETQGTGPSLYGYRAYTAPSITCSSRSDPSQTVVEGQTIIYVLKTVAHCQIPTAAFGTDTQEVVAVRFRVGRRNFTVASTYVRPRTAQHASTRVNFSWMRRLRAFYPHDAAVFAGDFNAEHKAWGYQISRSRGLQLLEEADEAELHLVNDLSQATRRTQNPAQRDTVPDLTWATANAVATWSREPTPWSSDHYPIWIQLSGIDKKCRKHVLYTNWQRFRDLLIQPTEHDGPDKPCPELIDRILGAAKAATSISEVEGDSPPPDRHLVNLWKHRDELGRCTLPVAARTMTWSKYGNKLRRFAVMQNYSLASAGKSIVKRFHAIQEQESFGQRSGLFVDAVSSKERCRR
ncbi:hypothetical protein HPB48_021641 [Haemaphysalis longicornis]|uniref:Endonuclease/exonuclease/phosphatase domain-containing protein n=1 Tax=Haemaphysalis longicornis TaxID=44386 RepID=A0A9J6F6K6_HAELO|nr:hypothetical protein HPB48_021641 [Haemaphysalis longicornis]